MDWPDKLITIATIFNEFDGKPYDRDLIEQRLSKISSRVSGVRDASKIRDEISAYASYLGVYKLELVNNIWHVFLTETAKKLLVNEEPDVATFLILQLSVFQFPNGNGVSKTQSTNKIRVQANARTKTKDYLQHNITLSPLRLLCKSIKAMSLVENSDVFQTSVSKKLLFILANDSRINQAINPNIDDIIKVISEFKSGHIAEPKNYESRFHLLKHTGLINPDGEDLSLVTPSDTSDRHYLVQAFNAILNLDVSYDGFESCDLKDNASVEDAIKSEKWGKYFDAIVTLPMIFCEKITSDLIPISVASTTPTLNQEYLQADKLYEFKEFDFSRQTKNYSYSQANKTDPEVTRILRQRANLSHKILLEKLYDHLLSINVVPLENEHIDLYAPVSDEISYVFEVKSLSSTNLLSQTRKGLSQLYEYKYRYKHALGKNPKLCLVFPVEPVQIDWLQNYLILDRKINVMWFDETGLKFPKACQASLRNLVQV
jgi:hypothetical protein